MRPISRFVSHCGIALAVVLLDWYDELRWRIADRRQRREEERFVRAMRQQPPAATAEGERDE